ncbi:MAG: bifunctional folylpolyglutamate synthase/dihydrofolate synthase [Bacteroidetes bacterium]|nr:MAG: bifunctional folylpolyglutamate synthase/dihydrofolate synthase [Bacteroidota bacterium]
MNYQQTLDFLYAQLPMFHRIGPAAYKANLDNTWALANHLGNPERKFRSIHIAGTNGKGSVAHLLASVFQESGYKTGLCTSPHLKDFRERFRVNGEMMPESYVTGFVEKHMEFFEIIKPSFFEMTIAMTFAWFAEQKVDIAIIETGLGGRLDSTNIIQPELSVITNVGLDHVNLLGNTIEEIAREKAGIIKPGIPVVVGKTREEAMKVIIEKSLETSSPIYKVTENYWVDVFEIFYLNGERLLKGKLVNDNNTIDFECPLSGTYQLENICTVALSVDIINRYSSFSIYENALKNGLKNVVKNTGIQGRWQILSEKPFVICDTGHNTDGIASVLENIRMIPHSHLHFVLGMMNDKDIQGILNMLPVENTSYYFCRPDVPRGLAVKELHEKALQVGLKGEMFNSVISALKKAKANAGEKDLIFVGGSTFVVAEIV